MEQLLHKNNFYLQNTSIEYKIYKIKILSLIKEDKMPNLKTYDLFISHSWDYSDEYEKMVKLLDEAPNFDWRNYSSPKHDPAINPNSDSDKNELIKALRKQISPVNCVIVLSGLYVAHSFWIQKEIDIAMVEFEKPIIGVKPWGNAEIPQAVRDAANEIVGWNTSSIVDAIRRNSI